MYRAGLLVMASFIMTSCLLLFAAAEDGGSGEDLRDGPVDSGSNGEPAAAWIDSDAVKALEDAQRLFQQEGHEREVISAAKELVGVFEENEDFSHLVDCLFLIAEAHYYLGEWTSAEHYMQLAAELGYRYFPDEMSTYPLKVIGESQFQQGNVEDALQTFQERVQLLRKGGQTTDLAGALFDVGGVLINTGREEEAIEILQEALTVNEQQARELAAVASEPTKDQLTANAVDRAEITYHIAIANFRIDRLNQARIYLEQANDDFRAIHESGDYDVEDRLASVLDDLVLVSENLNNMEAADRYRQERDAINQ